MKFKLELQKNLFLFKISFFNPIIIENSQDFHTIILNTINDDIIIGPYEFSRKNFINTDILALFNIPVEIIVYIGEIAIPSNCFDYFNPLLINSQILEKIKFINKNNSTITDNFKCNILSSKILYSLIHNIMDVSIYYPPGFNVDYKNMTASRSSNGKQICDFLSKYNQIQSIPISYPIMFQRQNITPSEQFINLFEQFLLTANHPLTDEDSSEEDPSF